VDVNAGEAERRALVQPHERHGHHHVVVALQLEEFTLNGHSADRRAFRQGLTAITA